MDRTISLRLLSIRLQSCDATRALTFFKSLSRWPLLPNHLGWISDVQIRFEVDGLTANTTVVLDVDCCKGHDFRHAITRRPKAFCACHVARSLSSVFETFCQHLIRRAYKQRVLTPVITGASHSKHVLARWQRLKVHRGLNARLEVFKFRRGGGAHPRFEIRIQDAEFKRTGFNAHGQ